MVNAQSDPAALRVSEALMMLDVEQRDVLLALHYGRLTVAEAAIRLGISRESVSHRALTALRTLRRLLDQDTQPSSAPPLAVTPELK
jgi:DNA-directed RNA polymerase specialized sigma24 family protein